jgi:hypothetical protein
MTQAEMYALIKSIMIIESKKSKYSGSFPTTNMRSPKYKTAMKKLGTQSQNLTDLITKGQLPAGSGLGPTSNAPQLVPMKSIGDVIKNINTLKGWAKVKGAPTKLINQNIRQLEGYAAQLAQQQGWIGPKWTGTGPDRKIEGDLGPASRAHFQSTGATVPTGKQNVTGAAPGFTPGTGGPRGYGRFAPGAASSGASGLPGSTPTITAANKLAQQGKHISAAAKASAVRMDALRKRLSDVTKIPMDLMGKMDLRDADAMLGYETKQFKDKQRVMDRGLLYGEGTQRALGLSTRGAALEAEGAIQQERAKGLRSGIVGKEELQMRGDLDIAAEEARLFNLSRQSVPPAFRVSHAAKQQESRDKIAGLKSQKKVVAKLITGDKEKLEKTDAEIKKNRIYKQKEEVEAQTRRIELIKDLNLKFGLQANLTEASIRADETRIDQLMKGIDQMTRDGDKTDELIRDKAELSRLIKELPMKRLKSATENLELTINDLTFKLGKGFPELQKQWGLEADAEGLNLEKDLRKLNYQKGLGFDKDVENQRQREKLNISQAERNLGLGTGTHRQVADAQNQELLQQMRRGDRGVAATFQKQIENKMAAYNSSWKEDLLADLNEVQDRMSGAFESGWESWITGAKSGKDALKDFVGFVGLEISRTVYRATLGRFINNVIGSGLGALSGAMQNNAQGGLVGRQGLASGGPVRGGSGVKDDVPANLTKGEYVMRKSAVNKYGEGFFGALNGGRVGMAAGGDPLNLGVNKDPSGPWYGGSKSAAEQKNVFQQRTRGIKQSKIQRFIINAQGDMGPDMGDEKTEGGRPGFGRMDTSKSLTRFSMMDDATNVAGKFAKDREKKYMDYQDMVESETDSRMQQLQAHKDKIHEMKKAAIFSAITAAVFAGIGAAVNMNAKSGAGKKMGGKLEKGGGSGGKTITDASTGNAFIVGNGGGVDVIAGPGFGQYENMSGYLNATSMTGEVSSSAISDGFRDGRFNIAGGNARGGAVKGFANGGVNRDTVPSMLMGGEFVLNRNTTKQYGTGFLDKLNKGQVSKFQDGGPVGMFGPTEGTAPVAGSNQGAFSDSVVKLVDLVESIQRDVEEKTRDKTDVTTGEEKITGGESAKGMVNNVNITVNISDKGKTEVDTEASTEAGEEEEGGESRADRGEKLADQLRGVVLATIVKEQRPGGLLQKEI